MGVLFGSFTPNASNIARLTLVVSYWMTVLVATTSAAAVTFTDISAGLEGIYTGSSAWGDFDGDGDLDIAICGMSSSGTRISRVYRNDGGAFTNTGAALPGVERGSLAWGDYDGDGDLDLVVAGRTSTSFEIARVFRNDAGVFTDIAAGFTGVFDASVAWGDYDNDGDLDVIVMGDTGTIDGALTQIYRNDSGAFVAVTGTGVANMSDGSVAWGDYDNDGDLDLLIAGSSPRRTHLYRNTGGTFALVSTALVGVNESSVAWGDYDSDGDLDILIAGRSGTSSRIARVYRNDGGTFTDIVAGLAGVSLASVAWGDHDNDGDLDILLNGYTGSARATRVYRNDGGGVFTEAGYGLPGMEQGEVAWGDYDSDGDLDLLTTGTTNGAAAGAIARVYRSDGAVANTVPMTPGLLTATVAGDSVTLSWAASIDAQTPQAGLSYNLQIGTTPRGNEVMPGMCSGWGLGLRRVVQLGNAQTRTTWRVRLPQGGLYYWSVQAVDGAYAGSAFAAEQTFRVVRFTQLTGISDPHLDEVYRSAVAWGDYNGDGDLDLLITGNHNGAAASRVYRNDGSGTFTDTGAALNNVERGAVAWGDYDGDGDLDLLLTGSGISRVYRNDAGVFTDIVAGLTGVTNSSVAWGDYDRDGDLDILLHGEGLTRHLTRVYRNDDGVFTDIVAGLPDGVEGSAAWGDYDNDGDLDILLAGSLPTAQVFRNDGGAFVDIVAGLPQAVQGSAAWGDYDNDGDLDILIAGNASTGPGHAPISRVYRNDGGTFADVGAGLTGVDQGSVAWGDYDNDGDLDILLTGTTNGNYTGVTSRVYRNEGGGVFVDALMGLTGRFLSAAVWGDYDNDGDLDILLTGTQNGNQTTAISWLYRNDGAAPNTVPTAPSGLSAVRDGDLVTFSWTAGSDAQTSSSGLSYNLRLGTTSGGNEIVPSMSDAATGYRRVLQTGNAQKRMSWTLNASSRRVFNWSVQAVDAAFAGSMFAPEMLSDVGEPPVVVAPPTVSGSEGSPLSFTVLASDPDGEAITSLTASGTAMTAGAAFTADPDNTSGAFSWTPTYTQAGSYSVTFTASNLLSGSATTAITINDTRHTLTITVVGSGGMTKSPDQPTYDHGEMVTLTATAAEGWHLVAWSGDLSGTVNPTTVTMDANKSVTATFSNTYSISSAAGPGGTITPPGVVQVLTGADQTFTITADPDYHIGYVLVDGVSQGAISSYTFPDVSSDHTIAAVFGTNPVTPPGSEFINQDLYVTNGAVDAVALSGATVYVGGWFTQVGPATGSGVPVDDMSGAPLSGFPKVTGNVHSVAPDGLGGWYIGGTFTSVGGIPRTNVAHVLPDKSVAGWDPNAEGDVTALVVSGTTVYVGGSFTSIGGQTRNRIAALDATTGLATAWNPNATGGVSALAVSGTTVYAGGIFTSIGGQTRSYIAALDATTGLATAWDPSANSYVYALVVSGTTVYVGGSFTSIGGQTRNRIAALDATTGLATAWNPSADSYVHELAVGGTTVYAGGRFSSIGGQTRSYIAALDATTGLATAWNPSANDVVWALVVSGPTVYAGGWFTSIGGQARNRIAALDAATGIATGWDPNANSSVNALAVSGATVFAGGHFTSLGGQARNHIAALDVTTGLATAWNPGADNPVDALAVSGTTVYAGGYFTSIGGQTRNHIAALDATTGLATAWDPNADGRVLALAVSGTTVYAGGAFFSSIGGQTRRYIAALDATTGLATAWDPSPNNPVEALAVNGTTVYAGGGFTSIGGQSRNRIAALDAATGLAASWNPNADDIVLALAASGTTLYAGGWFTSIGGQTRNHIAALDGTTGLATDWNPNADNDVNALAVSGTTVYAGGTFYSIGGQMRNHLAALDATTGLATPWDPNAKSTVSALAVTPTALYAGGEFTSIGNLPQSCIASITGRPPVVSAPATVSVEETGTLAFTVTASDPDGDAIASLTGDLSNLPSGHDATFVAGAGNTTGTFAWHPAQGMAGNYWVAFTAGNALTGTNTTRIAVAAFGSEITGKLHWKPKCADVGDYQVKFKAIKKDPPVDQVAEEITLVSVHGPCASGAAPVRRPAEQLMPRSPQAPMKGPIVSAPETANVTVGGTLIVDVSASGADSLVADLTGLPPDNTATFTVDHEPALVAPETWSGEPGVPLTFPVTASDPDGDPILELSADLTSLPEGHDATFAVDGTNTSGTFNWTPAATDSGMYQVRFKAVNALVRYETTVIRVHSGLVGYWALNGNGLDGARGNTLSEVGSVTYVDGCLGQGADIDGADYGSRLTCAAASLYDFEAGFTAQCWVKWRSVGLGSEQCLMSGVSPDGNQSWELYLCEGGGSCTPSTVGARVVSVYGSSGSVVSSALVGEGEFHHVAMTYDGTNLQLVVDGVANNVLVQGGMNAYVLNLTLGMGVIGQQFGGVLDDVRIYRVARSAAEIASDMNRELGFPTSVPEEQAPRYVDRLDQNRPNPFNPVTEIGFELERGGRVRLEVFDVTGRLVAELVDRDLPAGRHRVSWWGRDGRGQAVASGVYYYRLVSDAFMKTRSMVLLK